MKNISILFCTFILLLGQVYGQISDYDFTLSQTENGNLYVTFNSNSKIKVDEVFTNYKGIFNLSEKEEMKLLRVTNSAPNEKHYWYQLYHEGIAVEGVEYIIHTDSAMIAKSGNGRLIDLNKINSLNESGKSQPHTIKISEIEKYLTKIYPTYHTISVPEFVYVRINDSLTFEATSFIKTIKVILKANDILNTISVYLDPLTLNIIRENSDIKLGFFNSLYNGTQLVMTNSRSDESGFYYMLQDINKNLTTYEATSKAIVESKNNDSWTSYVQQVGASAQWAVAASYQYFWAMYGRRGVDGNNKNLEIRCNYGENNSGFLKGAGLDQYNADVIFFGKGDDIYTKNFAALDIAGHEYTHGIISNTANLANRGESGAIAESICDIFGCLVEWYTFGTYSSSGYWYVIGSDIAKIQNAGFERSLRNPKSLKTQYSGGMPNTYKGEYWIGTNSSIDNGGIHVNGGPLNYWFYLLAEGGNGTNDYGTSYNISPIGIPTASNLVYKSLSNLISTSTYADMRTATIQNAIDTYGDCSFEASQVKKAWDAIGVSANSLKLLVCGNLTGSFVKQATEGLIISSPTCSYTTVKSGANIEYKIKGNAEIPANFKVEPGASFKISTYKCE